jgi:hypothetical protein
MRAASAVVMPLVGLAGMPVVDLAATVVAGTAGTAK